MSTNEPCLFARSHDRFTEASYFFHQMHENYHTPREFRYNVHAFLNALDSLETFITKDLEKVRLQAEWSANKTKFADDPLLKALSDSRNTTVHQEPLLIESRVQGGLFRYRKIKIAASSEIISDTPTKLLLAQYVELSVGKIIEIEHYAIGEQIGVKRLYYAKNALKDGEDLLTATRRGILRAAKIFSAAHEIAELVFDANSEEDMSDPSWSDGLTVLLETDVDPALVEQWEWNG